MKSTTNLEYKLMSDLLQYYSLQRHDFLNHWQVIMGNLQLNKPEAALSYMRETVAIPQTEQKIGQIPEPGLAAILLGLMIRLRLEGVGATLDYPEEMKQEDFWREHWRQEYAEALYGYTSECLVVAANSQEKNSLSCEVYLYDDPLGISFQCILAAEETVLFDKMIKFAREQEE